MLKSLVLLDKAIGSKEFDIIQFFDKINVILQERVGKNGKESKNSREKSHG